MILFDVLHIHCTGRLLLLHSVQVSPCSFGKAWHIVGLHYPKTVKKKFSDVKISFQSAVLLSL